MTVTERFRHVFACGKAYQLMDVRYRHGGSKTDRDEWHKKRIGCITPHIRLGYRDAYEDLACLFVWLVQDKDGNVVDDFMKTSAIMNIQEHNGFIKVTTYNSVYVFQEAAAWQPEIQKTTNLVELWIGRAGTVFGRGIHYDSDGIPHLLTNGVHTYSHQDSCPVRHSDNPTFTVARYYNCYRGIEWYDLLGQQQYPARFLVHNEAEYPLTFHLEPGEHKYSIAPGGDALIGPNRET